MGKDVRYEIIANLEHPNIEELNKYLNGIFDISMKYTGLIKVISSQEGEEDSFSNIITADIKAINGDMKARNRVEFPNLKNKKRT